MQPEKPEQLAGVTWGALLDRWSLPCSLWLCTVMRVIFTLAYPVSTQPGAMDALSPEWSQPQTDHLGRGPFLSAGRASVWAVREFAAGIESYHRSEGTRSGALARTATPVPPPCAGSDKGLVQPASGRTQRRTGCSATEPAQSSPLCLRYDLSRT
jgi:hypothetical protein